MAATGLACRVSREFTGKSRKALSSKETLNDKRSMGSDILQTEIASLTGIDMGSRFLAVLIFLSEFVLLLSRNL